MDGVGCGARDGGLKASEMGLVDVVDVKGVFEEGPEGIKTMVWAVVARFRKGIRVVFDKVPVSV